MADQEVFQPFLVAGDVLRDLKHETFQEGWAKVRCRKREAYGCGENGKRIVDGVDLYTRPGPEGHPYFCPGFCVTANRGVLNLIGCEIDDVLARLYGRAISICGKVLSAQGGVMLFRIFFFAEHQGSAFRSYCLVYDSDAPGAFFLLPDRPHDCLPLCPAYPLKLGQDKFSVVQIVERSSSYPVVCLWSPPALTCIKGKHSLNNESAKCGWFEKEELSGADPLHRQIQNGRQIRSFIPTLAFSYKGNAVWGDLAKGILYCDWADLNVGRAPVNFKLKMFPLQCKAASDMDMHSLPFYRSMGCLGDSIWLVTIQPLPEPEDEQCPGETMVNVWTLDRLSEEEDWKPHREFSMRTVWDQLDGSMLPNTVPIFPFFRQMKDDVILFMMLPESNNIGEPFAQLLGINLSSSGSCEKLCLLMPPRRLGAHWLNRPLVLDAAFFSTRPPRLPV